MRVKNNEMMRSATPFLDFKDIITNVPNEIIFHYTEKLIGYIIKNRKTIFNPKNIEKNFGWFQLGCLGIVLILSYDFEGKFRKIHAKPLAKIMNHVYKKTLRKGFTKLYKIEPKLAYEFYKTLEAFVIGVQIGDITGVYSFHEMEKMSRRFTGVTCEWMCY